MMQSFQGISTWIIVEGCHKYYGREPQTKTTRQKKQREKCGCLAASSV